MKKFLKALGKFFQAIYKVIDKIVVTPISRLVFKINEYFKNNNGLIEKVLNRPNMLIYISLFFAVAVFFLVDSKVISFVETEAEIITGQPVEVVYNEEAYVVEGIPETVDITLIGRKSDLYLAKQLGDHEVILDLTNYGVGEHKVKLTYKQTIETLDYKLDPSSVLVIIKEKISALKDITYDLLNQDKLDKKLSVKSIALNRSEVVVKGSEDALAEVATVKALIDLNNEDLKTTGSFEIEAIPLVAYDENGAVIDNVEIVPATVTATVDLESYSVEVPIKVITTGDLTVGYAISSIIPSVSKVVIYGDQEVLDTIQYIPVSIDISGLKSSKTFNANITKPSGVRYMSETTTSIAVTLDSQTSKEITGVQIETKNLADGYSASAKSIADTTITVTAKGVKSILDNFTAQDISAYVDLTGYTAGTYSVPIIVETDDVKVQLVPNVNTIDIVIKKS
ncbi:MAG TPA: CdaR family protein [Bacilli bacterium]|nr:CdaR family protein [Bacilli bacterium]